MFEKITAGRRSSQRNETLHVERETVRRASDIDDEILASLVTPATVGETTALAFQRKEKDLAALFVTLPPRDAKGLRHRLSSSDLDDPVVAAFARILAERQQRLLAILADAPRRAAIAAVRGVR